MPDMASFATLAQLAQLLRCPNLIIARSGRHYRQIAWIVMPILIASFNCLNMQEASLVGGSLNAARLAGYIGCDCAWIIISFRQLSPMLLGPIATLIVSLAVLGVVLNGLFILAELQMDLISIIRRFWIHLAPSWILLHSGFYVIN